MTGLFLFFLIYISLVLSGVYVVWYLINNFETIIFRKNSE